MYWEVLLKLGFVVPYELNNPESFKVINLIYDFLILSNHTSSKLFWITKLLRSKSDYKF